MQHQQFFYRVHSSDAAGNAVGFLGAAFPVAPNGTLLTCRQVVDLALPEGHYLAVWDNEFQRLVNVWEIRVPRNRGLDLALLPKALQRDKTEFFPVLTPHTLTIGDDLCSFGYFALGVSRAPVEQGYFAGKIVNFVFHHDIPGAASVLLPFAVLEGMSGSPVLTYHNGVKLAGLAYGNRTSRILASEVLDLEDQGQRYHETVHRLVEFGVAYHCTTIVDVLTELRVEGFVVSNERLSAPPVE